ncbi:hypothetical protein [Nocardioides aquaticus]|nr:hypothetical protein [Nocardioides aquaticus]
MPSRILLLLPALAVVLAGCGDDSSEGESTSAPSTEAPPSPSEEPAPEGESDDCRVAAATWTDRVGEHSLDGSTTAPAFAETVNLDNLRALDSEMSVLCSKELYRAVQRTMVPLTEMNYELSLCALYDRCDPAAAKKVRALASDTAQANNKVRDLI